MINKGYLDNWEVVGRGAYGTIYNSNDDNTPNGQFIQTTKVLGVDKENGVLHTTTGDFILGEPKQLEMKGL